MGITYEPVSESQLATLKNDGDVVGLFGRMPQDLQKLVRKIVDAPNYDFASMEMLDALGIEWRAS